MYFINTNILGIRLKLFTFIILYQTFGERNISALCIYGRAIYGLLYVNILLTIVRL